MKLKPIKDKKKIDMIFEEGLFIRGDILSIKFYDFNDNNCFYGISIPKKNIRRSVDRNLLKRRLRHCLSGLENKSFFFGKSFFVIYMSDKILSSSELSASFRRLNISL